MQMRLSITIICVFGTFYRNKNRKEACWFHIHTNDAQDNPYLYKEFREGKWETATIIHTTVFLYPCNLRVHFPKIKLKSTHVIHRKLTGATEEGGKAWKTMRINVKA